MASPVRTSSSFIIPTSSSTSSRSLGRSARSFIASTNSGDAPVTTRFGVLITVFAVVSSCRGMNTRTASFSQVAAIPFRLATSRAASLIASWSLSMRASTSPVRRVALYIRLIAAPPTMYSAPRCPRSFSSSDSA